MMTEKKSNFDYFAIANIAAEYAEDIFQELGIDYKVHNKYFTCQCPIHDGDNSSAFNFYPDGYLKKGHWICNTRHCEKKYKNNIIGLVQGVFSKEKYCSYRDAAIWICDFCKIDVKNIQNTTDQINRISFIREVNRLDAKTLDKTYDPSILSNLDIPSKYYLNRKYSKEILIQYNVGDCNNPNKKMYNRAVFPIFNIYDDLVGFTGRSIFEKCSICHGYHHEDVECKQYPKWLFNDKFNAENHLFNIHLAKNAIKNTKRLILVEGPGDVLRLAENGIYDCVSTFGAKLTDRQQILIETLNILNVIIIMDNDEVGNIATDTIYNRLKRFYKIDIIKTQTKDIGELNEINSLFG